MKIAVIGAGIIGATTAYALAKKGFDVSIFEKNSHAAHEASYANGAQLSYSYVMPLAEPSILKKIPQLILNRDPAVKFKLCFDPSQWQFGINFIKACTSKKAEQTSRELLSLAYLSRDQLHDYLQDNPVVFDYRHNGKLVIYRDAQQLHRAITQCASQATYSEKQYLLNTQECLQQAPELSQIADRIAGGIYTPSEAVGDCCKFAQQLLARLAQQQKVTLYFNHNVEYIQPEKDQLTLHSQQGKFVFNHVVICSGIDSLALCRPLGIKLPLYPLKGYSLTIPLRENDQVPDVSITDAQHKIVYAKLGHHFRIAAMVDMGDRTKIIHPGRIQQIITSARELFPHLDYDHAESWAGLRPATATGKPIIEQSSIPNLWLNIGHGALGFTLAMGSGRLISDLISQEPSPIDHNPFKLNHQ